MGACGSTDQKSDLHQVSAKNQKKAILNRRKAERQQLRHPNGYQNTPNHQPGPQPRTYENAPPGQRLPPGTQPRVNSQALRRFEENPKLGATLNIEFINPDNFVYKGQAIIKQLQPNQDNPHKEQRNTIATIFENQKIKLIDLNNFMFIRHGKGIISTPAAPKVIEMKANWVNGVPQPNFEIVTKWQDPKVIGSKEKFFSINCSISGPELIYSKNKFNEKMSYFGEHYFGIKHGKGTFMVASKPATTLKGSWKYDCLDGPDCSISHKDGSQYHGECYRGLKNGQGIAIYPNGDKYNGQWKMGVKHGKGVLEWGKDMRYHGYWVDGIWFGKGAVYKGDQLVEEKAIWGMDGK